MRFLTTYILVVLFAVSLNAQEEVAVDSTTEKIKLNRQERAAFRKEKVAKYYEWERKYFNSPGQWYMSVDAGYGYPFLTTEPEAVPPVTFLGTSNFFQSENMTYDKLLLSGQGGGFRATFTVGKMFNHYVGLEFKFGYLKARTDNLATVNTPNFYAKLDNNLFELSVNPQLVLRSPNMRNFYLFGKVGPYIPQFGRPTADVIMDDRNGSLITGLLEGEIADILTPIVELDFTQDLLQTLGYRATLEAHTEIKLQQNFDEYKLKEIARAVGISASAGFRYQFSPIASIYGEIAVKGYNISLSRVIIEDLDVEVSLLDGNIPLLSITEEGAYVLGQFTEPAALKSLLETRFLNELTEESNNPNYNPNGLNPFNPRDELAPRLSVLSVGFNIGLQINFPGKHVYYRENGRKARKANL